MSERRCGECGWTVGAWYDSAGNKRGLECHGMPPTFALGQHGKTCEWPVVHPTAEPCSVFKPKETESQCSRCRHVRGHGRPRPAMPCKKFKPKEVKPVEPAVFCKTCKHWEATGFNAFMQPLTGRCHKGCGVNNARHTCPKHEEAAEPRTCRECKWYRADVVVNRRTEGDCTHPTPINGRTRETYNCDVFDRFKE